MIISGVIVHLWEFCASVALVKQIELLTNILMVHAMWFSNVFCSCILGNSAETGPGVQAKATMSRLESIREILDIIFRGGGQDHAKYYRVSFSSVLCISLIAFLHSFSLCVHPMKLFPPNPLYLYLQHNDCIFYCTLTTILNLSSFM